MAITLDPPGQFGVSLLVLDREARTRLTSPWLYVVASVVCVLAFAFGAGFQQTFATESVLITTDPLMALNIAVVVFLSIVLGLRLAASMAWEREHRTLEVLVLGSAGWSAIIAAKFAAELGVLIVLLAIYALYLLVGQPLGQGVLGPREMAGLATVPVFGLPTLALGLLAGAAASSVRGAVVVFLAVMVLLVAFELELSILTSTGADQLSLFSLYLRATLETAASVVRPISAMAQLANPIETLTAQVSPSPADAAWALALTAATLAAAALAGRMRGAL
jgi:ABC-type Na+ efflux pump permease subunit